MLFTKLNIHLKVPQGHKVGKSYYVFHQLRQYKGVICKYYEGGKEGFDF